MKINHKLRDKYYYSLTIQDRINYMHYYVAKLQSDIVRYNLIFK